MDLSIVDDIEDHEIIDPELGGDTEDSIENEIDTQIMRDTFTVGSLFIVIFEEDGDFIDKLLTVDIENLEQDKILLKDEDGSDETLYFDTNDMLIMNNSFYSIHDIMKVEELNDDIEKVELSMISELYPDIEIEVEEIQDKTYSLIEKRNDLITELIMIYKAYDNDLLILHLTDTVNQLIEMYSSEKLSLDDSDTHSFIQKIIQKGIYEIPKWILPIIKNKKKIYKQEKEEIELSDDIFLRKFEDEVIEKYNLLTTLEGNHYEKYVNTIHSYNPYQDNNQLSIPYHGTYLRDCKSPCSGLNTSISFDMIHTKDELSIPLKKGDKITNEIISEKEQVSISGFYALPHTFLDITMEKDALSLHELYFLSDFKYSNTLLKTRIHDIITNHIINHSTMNEGEDLKEEIHSYMVENSDEINVDDLGKLLRNNLPGYTNLLASIPQRIQNVIYNYSDFKRAYLSYNLSYHTIDKKNRTIINELIQRNIKRYLKSYNRSVKRKVVKQLKKKKTILSTKERIQLCRDFIMGIHVVHIRNHYLKKFINVFSREPKLHEDQNYLYEKDSEDKLLCKHYLYEIQSHKNQESLNILKSVYGGETSDGFISCKVCKEYICHEDFTTLEGFADGAPTSSKEVIDTKKDEINQLNEEQLRIKKRVQKISSIFGINLNNHDKQSIIEYHELLNSEEIINERYNVIKSYKEHPEFKKIKDKYTIIKPARTKEEKLQNKKNKERIQKDLLPFKNYLLNCNEVFINTFFILFLIQTSNPPYPVNPSLSVDLWDFTGASSWNEIEQDLSSKIVIDTVGIVKKIIQKMVGLHRDEFWKNINKMLNEEKEYSDLPSFHNQFISVTEYLLKNETIRKKLKEYYHFKEENVQKVYLNEYWTTYKPLFDNKIVLMINKRVNDELPTIKDYLLKSGQEYLYGNISSIRSFEEAYENPRFKQLKIPFSEIMKNESYERLFNYAVHLHGKSPKIPIINLLIEQFIQTVNDQKIEAMLGTIGWSPTGLKSIDYSKFRLFFMKDITEYFKTKNQEDIDTVNIYIHFHMNNWNGMLLNGNSKRDYEYIPPTVFPDESFEDLMKVEDSEEGITRNFVNELFNRYCFDENEEINERYEIDRFIYNIIDDPTIERSSVCHKLIPKTKENFYKILDYKTQKSKLPLSEFIRYDATIESRLRHFIKDNQFLKQGGDESYIILRSLRDFTEDTPEKQYRLLFNDMFTHNSFMINKIQEFFHNNQSIDREQIDRYRYSFQRNVDSLSIMLNKLLEKTEKIPTLITHVFHILSRLSNYQLNEKGVFFHNDIPKQWKLSDTNKEHLKEFLEKNEFLLHHDIFINQKEKGDFGFYQYQKEKKYSLCFQGLLDFLKQYYQKDYHIIKAKHNTQFTKEYSNIMNRFLFLSIFCKMIDYIESLEDDDSPPSINANILFSSLEEQDRIERRDSMDICTKLGFDILIDLLESFSDPLWIYRSENIAEKLSQQKEREKQSILDSIEHKTDDERHVMIHTQKCGLSTYFTKAEEENSSHIQTETYKLKTKDERSETAKELFSQNEAELEAIEQMGIHISNIQPGFSGIEEESHIPGDDDREGEGLDDFDDSGDYRED